MYATYIEATMAASYLIASQQWDSAEKIIATDAAQNFEEPKRAGSNPYPGFAALARTPNIFARGLAAAMRDSPQAHKSFAVLQEVSKQEMKAPIPFVAELREAAGIQAMEISAAAHAVRGEFDAAVQIMQKAAALVDAASPGPPPSVKPVHELFGEILLRAGRPKDAAEQFEIALRRHPNRARSLLGAARAFARKGDQRRAEKLYTQFAQQWQRAGAQSPELKEARAYAQQGGSG
jgi:hypothetical protein